MTEGPGKSKNKQLILSERLGFQYTVGTVRPGNRERADTVNLCWASRSLGYQHRLQIIHRAPASGSVDGSKLTASINTSRLNPSERFCLGSVSMGANSVSGMVLTAFMLYPT